MTRRRYVYQFRLEDLHDVICDVDDVVCGLNAIGYVFSSECSWAHNIELCNDQWDRRSGYIRDRIIKSIYNTFVLEPCIEIVNVVQAGKNTFRIYGNIENA